MGQGEEHSVRRGRGGTKHNMLLLQFISTCIMEYTMSCTCMLLPMYMQDIKNTMRNGTLLPHTCARSKVIGFVCLSVCLSSVYQHKNCQI